MTRRIIAASFAITCLSIAACTDKGTGSRKGDDKGSESTEPGPALFAATDFQPAKIGARTPEPVTVPLANVVILRKLDLPSKVDGTIAWVGVETDAATAAKLSPGDVYRHPRDKKIYRRMVPGMLVKRDQVVGLLDDEQAFIEWSAANTKADAAKKSAVSYEDTVTQLKLIVEKTAEGVRKGIVPEQELLNSKATYARYQAELVDHQGSADVAAAEAMRAKQQLDKCALKAAVEGEVQQVHKREGDGVKATEPVLTIFDIAKLRAMGNLLKEYSNIVAAGDDVTIEVPRDVPHGDTFNQHTTNKPIVAVAVAIVGGKPVIVSAAEDGWVYAWDREQKVLGSWRQPAGVRCLAVTRPDAEHQRLLVGGANGTASIYDLANPNEKVHELDGRHDGGVTAAAFSPDGRYCVTSDDRSIYMFDVSTYKRMYPFPAREHHSPITALSFTKQGRVVSVGKEPSVRVWNVGKDGAKVEHKIDSRSGDVAMPGVTDDGSRLLLDADKSHLDVIHLQDLRKERPLATAGDAVRFSTFTAWSPVMDAKSDDRLIATTGGADGVVQLWRAPTADARAMEVARLVTRGSAGATCAAFCPTAENGFIAVGTRKGEVHLWPLPSNTELQGELKATVTHVDKSIESGGRTVNVLVDFDNPKAGDKYLLQPGSAVTLVIKPKR